MTTNHHVIPIRVYLQIFAALLVLMFATIAASHIDLGAFNIYVALAIAIVKALLVVLYFMHVRYSSKLTWVFASAAFFWLLLLLAITASDYATRGWILATSGWEEAVASGPGAHIAVTAANPPESPEH
jgi:cytochrome c oxidase subunit IV